MAKKTRLAHEIASALSGQQGGAARANPWDAATRRKQIARVAREIEKLKIKRREARKRLDAIEDALTDAKRLYRDVIADAIEGPIDTPMPGDKL